MCASEITSTATVKTLVLLFCCKRVTRFEHTVSLKEKLSTVVAHSVLKCAIHLQKLKTNISASVSVRFRTHLGTALVGSDD